MSRDIHLIDDPAAAGWGAAMPPTARAAVGGLVYHISLPPPPLAAWRVARSRRLRGRRSPVVTAPGRADADALASCE